MRRAATEPVHGWELSILEHGKPVTASFSGGPWKGQVLLVGQFVSDQYVEAMSQVQATMSDIVALNREIARQKHEVARTAGRLAESNRELLESNQGVLALHRELDDRADALSRSGEIKSRVVSNVSHEFRSPLNSILGLTKLLQNTDGDAQRRTGEAGRLHPPSAEELMELVNDLLDLSRIEAGKASLRARVLVQRSSPRCAACCGPAADGPPVALVFDDLPARHRVETDQAKVAQVLRNFVSNALKFTERGEVRVGRGPCDDEPIASRVTDTGIGIARRTSSTSSRSSPRSTGRCSAVQGHRPGPAALAQARGVLGGESSSSSAGGRGSTFTDRAACAPRRQRDRRDRERGRRSTRRAPVLVLDDDRGDVRLRAVPRGPASTSSPRAASPRRAGGRATSRRRRSCSTSCSTARRAGGSSTSSSATRALATCRCSSSR